VFSISASISCQSTSTQKPITNQELSQASDRLLISHTILSINEDNNEDSNEEITL
jgi:hypothetical protein